MCPNQQRKAVLRNTMHPWSLRLNYTIMFPFILKSSFNTFTPVSWLTLWLSAFRPSSHLWKQNLAYLDSQRSHNALKPSQNHFQASYSFRDDDNTVDKQTFSPPDPHLHNLIHLQCNLQPNLVCETVIVLYWILMSVRWTQAPLCAVTVSYDRRLKERVISVRFHFTADSKSTTKGTSRGWRYQCSCHCVIN